MRTWAALAVAVAALGMGLAAALSGCSGEKVFTAEEFVQRANAEGAGFELEDELISSSGDMKIWALHLSDDREGTSPAAPDGQADPQEEDDRSGPRGEEEGDEHGTAASLVVSEDGGSAEAEFHRCEGAATLVCFRAANVVVLLESATSEEVARVTQAVKAMGSD